MDKYKKRFLRILTIISVIAIFSLHSCAHTSVAPDISPFSNVVHNTNRNGMVNKQIRQKQLNKKKRKASKKVILPNKERSSKVH